MVLVDRHNTCDGFGAHVEEGGVFVALILRYCDRVSA